MANIALCVGDTGHSTTTNAVSMLSAMGHTVTVYNETSVTLAQLLATDAICWLRAVATTIAALTTIKSAFDAGVPIVFASSSASIQGLLLDFCIDQPNNNTAVNIIEPGVGTYNLQTTAAFWYFLESNKTTKSAKTIATYSDTSGGITRIASAYALQGEVTFSGGRFPANIAFCGPLYSLNNTHTQDAKNLISRTINEILNKGVNVPVTVAGLSNLSTGVFVFNNDLSIQKKFSTDSNGIYSELFLREGLYTAVCSSTDEEKSSLLIDLTV